MPDSKQLSKQERNILGSLSSGRLYKEIAAEFHISINTVKKHIKNIYRKLNVSRRSMAAEKFNEQQAQFSEHQSVA